jgi:hypothetical protein
MAPKSVLGKVPKRRFVEASICCARSPFSPLFIPFGTTMWTFSRVNVQSTLWERFT